MPHHWAEWPWKMPISSLETCDCVLHGCKSGCCWNTLEQGQAFVLNHSANRTAGHFRRQNNVRPECWGGQSSEYMLTALWVKEPQSQDSGWRLEKEKATFTSAFPDRSTTLWVPSDLQNYTVIVF